MMRRSEAHARRLMLIDDADQPAPTPPLLVQLADDFKILFITGRDDDGIGVLSGELRCPAIHGDAA